MKFSVGEPVPWFVGRTEQSQQFHFHTCAGRYVVLCLFGSAANPAVQRVLDDIEQNAYRFDDENLCFFGVSTDPEDERWGRLREHVPGVRFFRDFDGNISRTYGATGESPAGTAGFQPTTLILDERLRVLASVPIGAQPESHVARILDFASRLPPIAPPIRANVQAPVLVVPRVFEPDLCRSLIQLYADHGGQESGFMRDQAGKTVGIVDYSHKRRSDYEITDERIRAGCMHRIHDRLVPEIEKAFQFRATRMERYIVACYESSLGGHFRAHRDNTTKGTAHRRFAVSLNLNAEEFEGGDLRFPEFGRQLYRPPTGGAVVFSCSLLHEATPVTRGSRYVFLPFLYDDAAARIREENLKYLAANPASPNETAYET